MYRTRLLTATLLVALSFTACNAIPASVQVAGQVTDTAGKPIDDAIVTLYELDTSDSTRMHSRVVQTAKTSAKGEYRVTLMPDRRRPGRDLVYSLTVQSPGYALAFAEVDPHQQDPWIPLRLGPPTDLKGRVCDASGHPVPGARVRVEGLRHQRNGIMTSLTFRNHTFAREAVTDSVGKFVIVEMAEDYEVTLTVAANGYAHQEMDVGMPAASGFEEEAQVNGLRKTGEITVVMHRAAEVSGRVVTEGAGRPVIGAKVKLWAAHNERGDRSNALGQFRIKDVNPGEYDLVVEYPASVPYRVSERKVRVREGGAPIKGIRIVLHRGSILYGMVIDTDTHKPIPGATVMAWAQGQWSRDATTSLDGSYQIAVPRGDLIAQAFVPGPEYDIIKSDSDPFSDSIKMASNRLRRDFSLSKGRRVRLRVVDRGGRPVRGALIRYGSFSGAFTNRFGHAEFRVAPGIHDFTILDDLNHLIAHTSVDAYGSKPGDPLVIRLQRACTVSGRVVDSAGKPLPRTRVQIDQRSASRDKNGFPEIVTVTTDSEGRYTYALLAPGLTHEVTVSKLGFGTAKGKPFSVQSGDTKELADIALPRASLSVSGIVMEPSGRPVAGAVVRLFGDEQSIWPELEKKTDVQGRFRIDGLAPGKLNLTCNRDGYRFENRNIQAGELNIRVTVMPERVSSALRSGMAAPDLVVDQWIGKDGRTISQLRGKVIALAFLGDTTPSIRFSDVLIKLHKRHESHGFVVLPVVEADNASRISFLTDPLTSTGIPVALLKPGALPGQFSEGFIRYGVQGTPSTFLIDRRGKLRHVNVTRDLEMHVEALLAEAR